MSNLDLGYVDFTFFVTCLEKMPIRAFLNTLAFLLILVVNYLSNALPLGGNTMGELADRYANLFIPAGYAFSIWGIIYLLLGYFIFRQWRDAELRERVGNFFIYTSVLNAAWLFAWHYEQPGLALIIMVALLFTLVRLYIRLQPHYAQLNFPQLLDGWMPFALYAGWVSVATIANASAFLVSMGYGDLAPGPVFWTFVMLLVGLVLAAWMGSQPKGWVYALAFVWGYIGIAVRQWEPAPVVAWIALGSIIALGVILAGRHRAARNV